MELDFKEKNEFLNLLKDNTKFILLGIYSLSFVNYYLYYKSFRIPIFNYIGLNDMLFFALEYVFNIILIIFLCEVFLFMVFGVVFLLYEKMIIFLYKKKGMLYIKSNKRNKERIQNLFNNSFNKGLLNFRFSILILSIFFVHNLGHSLLLFPTVLVYLIFYIEKISKVKSIGLSLIFSCGVIIIFLTLNTLVNSYNKRFIKDDYLISFNENSNFITTNKDISCFNYLGETSSYIFLYDIEKKQSKIYSKSNITELTINNDNEIDSFILKVKENPFIQFFTKAFTANNHT